MRKSASARRITSTSSHRRRNRSRHRWRQHQHMRQHRRRELYLMQEAAFQHEPPESPPNEKESA